MAFEMQIEADRPDDLGFLSSFVRAPVVGTIMWVFGGKEAKKIDEQLRLKPVDEESGGNAGDHDREDDELDHFYEAHSDLNPLEYENFIRFNRLDHKKDLLHGTQRIFQSIECKPNCIQTDTSEDGDADDRSRCMSPIEFEEMKSFYRNRRSFPDRQSNSISWSDHSGLNLCEYLDETKIALHKSSSDSKVPMRSAMKRCSSLSAETKPLHSLVNDSRRDENHGREAAYQFAMPGSHANAGKVLGPSGYISPQYGWYVTGSTTPPTPEMFANTPSSFKCSKACSSSTGDTLVKTMKVNTLNEASAFVSAKGVGSHLSDDVPTSAVAHCTMPSPQFTRSNKVVGNMGWPSLPL